MHLFADFGGDLNQMQVHIGLQCLGLLFVCHKRRVAWVSENSGISTKLSSPNLASGFYPGKFFFVLRF